MDPISAGLQIAGLGLQIFGGMSASHVAKQEASVSQDIAKQEQGINAQKQQQMQLEARRSQLQNFRNAQRLRAQATAAATSQGAQFGTGLAGGLAGVDNTARENVLGINQGMQISQNIFGLNQKISSDKMQLATLEGDKAADQGLMSLGGSLMKAGPTIGGISQDIMKKMSGFSFG